MSPWKVILAAMVIFASGAITGTMVTKKVEEVKTERAQAADVAPSIDVAPTVEPATTSESASTAEHAPIVEAAPPVSTTPLADHPPNIEPELTNAIAPVSQHKPAVQHTLTALAPPGRTPPMPLLQMQPANFLKLIDNELDLNARQRNQIAKIMKSSQERTQPLWNEIAPQMTNELKRVREEIRGVLTPDQRKKFVELMRRNRKGEGGPAGNARPPRS